MPVQVCGVGEPVGILRLRCDHASHRHSYAQDDLIDGGKRGRVRAISWSWLAEVGIAGSAFLLALLWCSAASATTYYVSNSGTDSAGCTTVANPCKTLGYVDNPANITLNPGDSVLMQRGGVWNEQLIPPASGTAGSPIIFDAYGTGAAPVLTPMISLAGASWTQNSGNIYTTTVSSAIGSPQVNDLQLGTIWGRKRAANPGCTSAGVLQGYGDFCVVYPTLYLYSPSGTPPSSYASISAVIGQPAGLAVISVVNKSWLVFQHIKIQNFDYMGVSVSGSSDNVIFANMESDGIVPYGTTPHGFYVNVASAANLQFLNDDAHLNYDGFHIDAASAVTISNCRGYANRDAGLKDNSGHATYSYSHFYGNNVAQLLTGDVVGAVAGSGNISSSIAPVVTNFARYPARFSFTVDDVGSSPNTEGYINTFLTMFSSRGIHFNAAVVPSYTGQNGENTVDWASVNTWYASGNEIDSHSWSHQYYTTNTNPQGTCTLATCPNAPALDIQYTGSGTAATLTMSGNVLSTNVTGTSGHNLTNIDLSSSSYSQMWQLEQYLAGVPHYTVKYDNSGPLVRPNTHTLNLAGTTGSAISVSGQDIRTAPFVWVYDQTKLLPDEMTSSKSAIQTNVPGLTEAFYVYPDGVEDPSSETYAAAAGYTAARGSLAMKGQDNATASANSLYANGVNVQNITSLAAIQLHGMSPTQISQVAQGLVFRAAAWGVPYGIFTHYNSRVDGTPDISNVELGYLLDGVTANGGVWMTNAALASAIASGTGLSGSTRYVQSPTGNALNLAAAGANSPTVGRGAGTSYPIDMNGTNRSGLGAWDIGATAYLSQRYGTGAGTGQSYIGWPIAEPPTVTFSAGLLGGIEVVVSNSNPDLTVSCITLDGSAPATNGDGQTCSHGFPSLSATHGGGYFSLTQSTTVKIVAGIEGGIDSSPSIYPVTVPQQTITATHFGFQCGAQADCAGPSGSITWPTYSALPKLMRLHDSRTAWPWVQYIGAATASGSTLTWVSGTQFITGTSWIGQSVAYNGATYTITAVNSATQMTVNPSIGTQANPLPFTVTNWTYVDDYVDAIAAHAGTVGMETFTLFPCGSAPTTTHCGINANFPNGTSTPPADFTAATGSPSYNAFVSALVNHQTVGGHNVRDYVKVWELQNEWDLPVHLNDCGSMTACGTLLYQMVVPIAAIIRANVPNAVILAPSATPASSSYQSDYAGWLNFENAQGRISDFPNWHLYLAAGGNTTNTPEVQWATYVSAAGTLLPIQDATAGWNRTGWTDTETDFLGNTFVCPTPAQYTEADCAGQIARWQILHDSNGSVSLDWYKFNSVIANGPTTPVSYATVYQNLQGLMIGGYFTAPTASDGNTPATWTAPFVESNNHPALWVWTDSEAGKMYTVPNGYSDYRDLNGGTTTVTGGLSVSITTVPVMLE